MFKKLKKALAAILSVLLLVTVYPAAYSVQGKAAVMDQVSGDTGKLLLDSLLKGNKALKQDAKIKRAEFFVLINRVFNFKVKAAAEFVDVKKTAWYYDDVSKLVGAEIIQGTGKGRIQPEAFISRQEAAVVIAKAFSMTAKNKTASTSFSDAKKIAEWSKESISALIENKCDISRTSSVFGPSDYITCADAIKMISKVAGNIKYSAGKYTGKVNGNLIVNTGDVTLKDMTIAGNLYLTQGIGNGNATLDGVKVKGKTYINGGGENSVVIKNTSLDGTVIVKKYDGKIRIFASDGTRISDVMLNSGGKLQSDDTKGAGFGNVRIMPSTAAGQQVKLDGSFAEISVEAAGINMQIIDGNIGKLEVQKDARDSSIMIDNGLVEKLNLLAKSIVKLAGGTVGDLTIGSNAENSKVELQKDAIVKNLTVNSKAAVTGEGKIEVANVNANDVTIEPVPDKLNVASGVVFNTIGKPASTPTPVPPPVTSTPTPTPTQNNGVSALVFGDSNNEQNSNLTVKGDSGVTTISTSVGELNDTYTVRYLDGKDSEMSFDMFNLTPNKPLTLEVEEIHNRGSKVLAYSVLVNGQEQYFRTYEEVSAGPNHYFINIDPSVVGDRSSVRVTFRNYGDSTVSFGRVWAYSDFGNTLTTQNVYRPMPICLLVNMDWSNYQNGLAYANKLKAEYSNYNMYGLELAFEIDYMKLSEEDTYKRIDYILNISKDTDIPMIFDFSSWWGGTPAGPDGKGGYWRDIPYNQVVYDPLNIDGKGNWKLSTPNVWSNTPWLSMNNDYYNSIRVEKISRVTKYISDKTAEFKADNTQIPPVSMFIENEPVYWPYYAFNLSPDAAGDFSPLVIDAAAKDGVTLNPVDGLSDQERLWMYNNLNKYITTVTKSIAEGFGHNAIVIDNGNITYPDYQLTENSYTHMFINPAYPNKDDKRGLWETHMVKDIRFGAEYGGNDSEGRYLDYIMARGKYGYVNTERTMLTDYSQLLQAYASGADYDNIFNFYDGDHNLIRSFDNKQDDKFYNTNCEDIIYSYDFKNADSLNLNSLLVEANGVRREPLGENYVVCPDNGSASGGEMTYKVDNQGKPLSTGLSVVLEGRCLSNMGPNCKIEVWVGAGQDQLTLVKTLTTLSTERIDVSDYIDKNQSVAYFKIKLYSAGLSSGLYSWTSITSLRVQIPWEKNSGHTNGFSYTLKQMRERSLWVSYRADVERMLSNYLEKAGQDDTYNQIKEQYDACNYVTAYNTLIRALSQLLPAKYIVKGSGTLDKYPVNMVVSDTEAKVQTTLYEYGASIKIGFVSDRATSVNLTLSSLNSSYYKAWGDVNGIYEIKPANAGDAGAVSVVNGKAVFTIDIPAETPKQYPATFEARYYGGQKASAGHIYIQSQYPAIGEYVDFIDLKLADNADIKRGAEGDADDRLQSVPLGMLFDGDSVKITMNSNQEVTAIKAYYGKVFGTVTSIQPISIIGSLQDAFIQIRDANGIEHKFEIGSECIFDSPKATGTNILTANVDDLGFRVGDQVTVNYSPYTYQGSEKRAFKIAEGYDTLVSETFEDENEGWKIRAFSTTNIVASSLDTNYKYKVIRPSDISLPGEIVWKLQSPSHFNTIAIEYSGRAIMGDASSVKWFVSTDNSTWTEAGGIHTTDPDGYDSNLRRSIIIDNQVNGSNTVYVKCEIRSGYETWGCLNDMAIKSKASSRELQTAALSLDNNIAYVGNTVPIVLNAIYDNGDTVNIQNVKVVYESDSSNILDINNDVIEAISPGSAQIKAYISDGGKVLETNAVMVEVHQNILGSIQVSPENNSIPVGGTTSVTAAVYNTDGIGMDISKCQITYTSDNESIATVSADGTVTGVGMGTANITANVTYNGVSLQKTVAVTVTERRTILQDDFESYQTGAVADAGAIGAYEVSNIQAEPVDPPNGMQKGLSGLYDGVDPGWQGRMNGYVIYKLDSANPAGFEKLTLSYTGRALNIPSVGANGTVVISAGDALSNLSQIAQMPQNGDMNTIYTQDLTGIAQGKNTIYIRVDIKAGRYTWAFLDSIKVEEEIIP